MTWGRNLVRPFGRVCSTRGPGESFEPESDSLRARARAAWTIDDARSTYGRYGGSARALPARFPSPGERAGLNNRREAA